MASRNKFVFYVECRNNAKRRRPSDFDHTSDLPPGSLVQIEEGRQPADAPAWMKVIEIVTKDLEIIKQQMNELVELHKRHLLPRFGVDDMIEEEINIDKLTDAITKAFQATQTRVQKIQKPNLPSEVADPLKTNVQLSLGAQLKTLSEQFTKAQRHYLKKLQEKHEKSGGNRVDLMDSLSSPNEVPFTVSFNPDQLNKVEQIEIDVSQREKEIKLLNKKINDLALIFRDIATLVVEQGTMLDRIDINIEDTKHHLGSAVEELKQGANYQKKYRNMLCMLTLCIGILVALIIFLARIFG